jgi:hypothetical protein
MKISSSSGTKLTTKVKPKEVRKTKERLPKVEEMVEGLT